MKNEEVKPPTILYKYRALNEFTKLILSKSEIYFAISTKLNDPFERFFSFKNGAWRIIMEADLPQLQTKRCIREANGTYFVELDAENNTKYFLNKMKKNESYGIFSLCECNNSIPMYSHYANGFKGICIGFDWEKFNLTFSESYPLQKNLPRKVNYLSAPPEISGTPEEWLNVFTTKPIDFSWEREWRIFYKKEGLTDNNFNVRHAIREIIFGHNIHPNDIHEVKEYIKDLDQINLFITEPVIGKFELQIKPYTDS